jgi:hypothetical protein
MSSLNKERYLWVCELNKEQPSKVWKASDLTKDEEEDDFIMNNLVIKTAVLGKNAVENERNLVALKTKEADNQIDQPILSLTLGKTDCVSYKSSRIRLRSILIFSFFSIFLKLANLDLSIITRSTEPVEFRLVDGSGPVFITCMHVIEVADSGMMDGDDDEDDDEEEEEEVEEEKANIKGGKAQKNGAKSSNAAEGAKKRKRN